MENPERKDMAENISFEEAYTRLGEVVQGLESGGLTLEQATRLYEEGMGLARLCNRLLTEADLKMTELKNTYDDSMAGQPPGPEE